MWLLAKPPDGENGHRADAERPHTQAALATLELRALQSKTSSKSLPLRDTVGMKNFQIGQSAPATSADGPELETRITYPK